MYLPAQFRQERSETVIRLMREFPLATLVTVRDGIAEADPCPLLIEEGCGGELYLRGHLSRSNPKIAAFAAGAEALAIFHGPQAYVSPTWYRPGLHVPTWNYAVVQASGPVRVLGEAEELLETLERLSAREESRIGSDWKPDFGDEEMRGLTRAIAGFEIRVARLEAKFKLSQNRDSEDRERVMRRFLESNDPRQAEVGALMRETR